jgi:predicted GNAT family N-acyltransferase
LRTKAVRQTFITFGGGTGLSAILGKARMPDLVRELSIAEVEALVLPLREAVWRDEVNWSSGTIYRDAVDDQSIHFGCVSESGLVGALRLTIKDSVKELPSSRYLPPCRLFESQAAELSRAVVSRRFRGRTVFPRLLCAAIARAIERDANYIFAIVEEVKKDRKLYFRHDLFPIGKPFNYGDDVITLPDQVVVLQKTIGVRV